MEELKEGWRRDKLEKLTNYIARGITPKYSENMNDMIVINQKCIRDGKLSLKDSRYHNYNLKKVINDKILKKYDILVNSTGVGTLGRVCQNLLDNKNLTVDTHVTIVRPNSKKINPIYLGFAMRNNQKFVESLGEGSTGQTELKRQRLAEEVEIFYPENIETQEKIASILSALDDKIEINNEINKTLEEMAQTLFKRWFIDFDFPNENGEPYKSSGGKMVDSELGEIPRGWEVNSLMDVCLTINSGGTPNTKTREYYGDEINWYSTKELQDKFLLESEKKITQLGLDKSSAKIFPKDSILMAIYAAPTVGRLGILIEESAFNQAAVGLVADEVKISYEYVYLYLLKERNNLNNLSNGAAQQNLNVSIVKNYKIIVPSKELNQLFKNIISSKFLKIKKNQQEIQSLTEIRDILLPKLMSGEVEI